MPNIVLLPSRIVPLATGAPSALVVHFELNPLLHDSRVRLLFYDDAVYRASELGRRADADLIPFKLPRKGKGDARPVLSTEPVGPWGSQADPTVLPGSGVLLKVEGRVKRDPKTRKWYFEKLDFNHQQNTGELLARVQLHMIASAQAALTAATTPVGADLTWPKADARRANGRVLARMVLVQLGQTNLPNAPAQGEQLLSSLSTMDNLAVPSDDLLAAPALVARTAPSADLPAFELRGLAAAMIGGPPPPTQPGAAGPTSRLLSPDLTGLYEEERPTPRLLLQLNQAGHALAGWWVRPKELPDRPNPELLPVTRAEGGSLAVRDRGAAPGAKWPLSWWDGYQDPVSLTTNVSEFRGGTLRLLPGAAPDQLDQRIELTLEGSDDKAVTLVMRRTRDSARWSNVAIAEAVKRARVMGSEGLGQTLEAEQLRPVAPREWDEWAEFCSKKNTDLIARLEAWLALDQNHPLRLPAREEIAKLFRTRLRSMEPHYRRSMVTRFHAYARTKESSLVLRTQDRVQTKTLLEWLALVVADEWEDIKKKHPRGEPPLRDDQIYKRLHEGWQLLQMPVPGQFLYTVTFQLVGKNVEAVIVGLGAHLVSAAIKKEVETVVRNIPTKTVDASYDPNLRFGGFFTEGGAGLAIGLKGGSLGGAAATPGGIEFRSAFDLRQRDFDKADISVTSIQAVSAGVAPLITFTGASSMLVTLILANGIELRGVSENFVQFETPKKLRDISLSGAGASATAVNFSLGYGKLLLDFQHPEPEPPEKGGTPAAEEKERAEVAESHHTRQLRVLFEVDESRLTPMSRLDLELDVAVERALFTTGKGWFYCGGYASPKGRIDKNRRLSQERAESVLQAIVDALGPALRLERREAVGWGEEASWSTLIDPWGDDQHEGKLTRDRFTKEEQALVLRQEDDEYWKWQRVDVAVQGVLIMKLRPSRERAK